MPPPNAALRLSSVRGRGSAALRPIARTVPVSGAPAAAVPWRVVEAGGEYRIMRDPEEPDVWDGDLGFRHTPPARVR